MNPEETTRLEEAVLCAADALREYQLNYLQCERQSELAHERYRTADSLKRQAAEALDAAELAHARNVYTSLEAERARRLADRRSYDLETTHYRALRAMLKACALGDRAAIIDASREFAQVNLELNQAGREAAEAGARYATAFLAARDSDAALAAARTHAEQTQLALDEAKSEMDLRFRLVPHERHDLHALQSAVANAAAAFSESVVIHGFRAFTCSDLRLELAPPPEGGEHSETGEIIERKDNNG